MTDPALLRAAIEASGLSARRFAAAVLGVDERTVRRWLAGEVALPPTVRRICIAGARKPALLAALEAAGE